MSWADIKGQERAITVLRSVCSKGCVAHAYLFHGPEGVGKRLAAKEMAKALLCPSGGDSCQCPVCRQIDSDEHPDVVTVVPTGASIKIDQIRELQQHIYRRPAKSHYSIAIIDQAEAMTSEAASALLKLLEEPPAYVCLILTCSSLGDVLPTVISRAQLVAFQPVDTAIIQAELLRRGNAPERSRIAAELAGGSFSRALRLAKDDTLLARRTELLSLIRQAGGLSDLDLLSWAERLGARKDAIQEQLHLLVTLLRDSWLVALNADAGLVVNKDMLPDLRATAEEQGAATLRTMTLLTLEASNYLRQNANLQLTLDWLCLFLGAAGARAST